MYGSEGASGSATLSGFGNRKNATKGREASPRQAPVTLEKLDQTCLSNPIGRSLRPAIDPEYDIQHDRASDANHKQKRREVREDSERRVYQELNQMVSKSSPDS